MKNRTYLPALNLANLVLLAGVVVVAYLTHSFFMYPLFNNDAIWFASFFNDLFAQGGHYKDWILTPNPYFFPDLLLYGILYAVEQNYYITILLYALAQIGITGGLVYAIKRLVLPRNLAPTFTIVSLAILVNASLVSFYPAAHVLNQGFHFGAVLLFLAATLLEWRIITANRFHWGITLLFFGICTLGSLSDHLFIIGFLVPNLCVLLLMVRRSWVGMPTAIRLSSLIALSIVAALALAHWAIPNPHTEYLAWNAKLTNHRYLWHDFDLLHTIMRYYTTNGLPFFAIVLCYYFLSAYGLFCCRQPQNDTYKLAYFFYATIVLGLLFTLLLVFYSIMIHLRFRYITLGVNLALLLWSVPLLLVPAIKQWLLRINVALVASVCIFVLSSAEILHMATQKTFQMSYYPDYIRCIDKAVETYHLKHGMGQYWGSKSTNMMSRTGVEIMPYFNDLDPYLWTINKSWYRTHYDFAVITRDSTGEFRIDPQDIIAINGQPKAVVSCPYNDIMIYGHNKLYMPSRAGIDTPSRDLSRFFYWHK